MPFLSLLYLKVTGLSAYSVSLLVHRLNVVFERRDEGLKPNDPIRVDKHRVRGAGAANRLVVDAADIAGVRRITKNAGNTRQLMATTLLANTSPRIVTQSHVVVAVDDRISGLFTHSGIPSPVVLLSSASSPMAVFSLPVVFSSIASSPNASFSSPSTLFSRQLRP